jgi:hypothetical protein
VIKLATVAGAAGLLHLASALAGLYAPDRARRLLQAFPRHEVMGWILTAAAMLWAGWLVLHTLPFSNMARIETMVYLGTPVCFFAVVVYMDELLAPRALGGLLLLVASPVLASARLHDSTWTVVITLLAYAWVIAGMVLVVSPFRFRRVLEPWLADRKKFRNLNLTVLVLGVALLALALTVYR